jgi:hypothetical protein
MKSAFEEVVGASPIIDSKKARENFVMLNDPSHEITTDDLEELLAELDVGYENRLEAFRSLFI